MALRNDWKAIRATGRRKPLAPKAEEAADIHEDWIAVRGDKHPAYGYVVKWRHAESLVIYRMKILGRRRTQHGIQYSACFDRVFYKAKSAFVTKGDRPDTGPYARNELCFTREDVELCLQGHRNSFMWSVNHSIVQLTKTMEQLREQIAYQAEAGMKLLRDPLEGQWEKIPKKPSAKLGKVIPEFVQDAEGVMRRMEDGSMATGSGEEASEP